MALAPPRKAEGAPPPAERLPQITSTATAERQGTPAAAILQRRADIGQKRRGEYPVANASLYHPAPGRARVWLSVRCPICLGVHLQRLRPGAEPGGLRRTPCGTLWVVVRRRYGRTTEVAS